MLPDRVSNPGPLTYKSGALPNALRCPAYMVETVFEVPRCKAKVQIKLPKSSRGSRFFAQIILVAI